MHDCRSVLRNNKIEYLINYLLKYTKSDKLIKQYKEKRKLLRALMNVVEPNNFSENFYKVQDELLKDEIKNEIIKIEDMEQISNIYLYQGDITKIEVDVVLNAANKYGLGCFIPNHGCIDNAIHSQAGLRLRNECNKILNSELIGTSEVIVTKAYNLASKYIIHSVGPIITGELKQSDKLKLKKCYENVLNLALQKKLKSIALSCISTGEYGFDNYQACQIAVNTAKLYKEKIKVVFNVFKDIDYKLYKKALKRI